MKPKQISIEDIRSWDPCYDPAKHLSEDWHGNVFDLMEARGVPFEDVLWVIMRKELVSEKLMRLFAVWCARQVQHLMTDERSIKALDVAEAFANGKASEKELYDARDAAWEAAWDASRDAAWDAARDAAWDVARETARDAVWDAARDAAKAAAKEAARKAVRDAAWDAQKDKLVEMLKAGIETGDVVLCERRIVNEER